MARPIKGRKICCIPENLSFGPLDKDGPNKEIIMVLEEYETIRLIDHEGLSQEECSNRMGVARTTVQRIYSDARSKLAKALVNGLVLRIEGGSFELYSDEEKILGCGPCRNRYWQNNIDGVHHWDVGRARAGEGPPRGRGGYGQGRGYNRRMRFNDDINNKEDMGE